MKRFDPDKLHVTFSSAIDRQVLSNSRKYTLTHSDRTGDLFLFIGNDYNKEMTAGWYTRLMRDEVFAELTGNDGDRELHVHCHVNGGIVFGTAGMRDRIFRKELPLVLEAIRYGDREYFSHDNFDTTPVIVLFHSTNEKYDRKESWGAIGDNK